MHVSQTHPCRPDFHRLYIVALSTPIISAFSPRAPIRVSTECRPRALECPVSISIRLNHSPPPICIPGPFTLRMMLLVVSSMNSTRTCVTPPREPAACQNRILLVFHVISPSLSCQEHTGTSKNSRHLDKFDWSPKLRALVTEPRLSGTGPLTLQNPSLRLICSVQKMDDALVYIWKA